MLKRRPWSQNRPQKPEQDPLYLRIVSMIEADKRSTWAKANVSGLSTSTLSNWSKGKVKHPQGISLQMAARMLGYEVGLVKKK